MLIEFDQEYIIIDISYGKKDKWTAVEIIKARMLLENVAYMV